MQSPERVAETYGGNKQKIAQAVQMGVIDPTTGLMAGMFIDRMRSAQAQEQAPNQTVAQRVLGPQAPPAPPPGLGATPQGMQMAGGPGPQMAAPPQMIPPAPQGPVRMAVGGLTTLPVPDDMYDEQSFAGGGIVAFADAGDVRTKRRKALMAVATDPDARSDQRMAARMELNAMEGMGAGAVPSRGLTDALKYTQDDLPSQRQPVSADASIYSPDGARAPQNVGEEPINVGPRARAPQSSGDSIYSPGGGGAAGNKEPLITGSSLASMFEPPARTAEQAAAAKAMYESRKEKPIPAPAWYGAAKKSPLSQEQQMNVLKDMKYHPMVGLEDVDPEGKQSGLSAFTEAGLKNYGSLLANAGIATTKGVGYAANAAGNMGAGAYDFAFTPRGKRPSSNYKPNLGSVNMGGYDPNRSSPEAQLNAILGKPAPDTGIGALLASQSARADTAPTRIPGAGRRTGAGAATTRPTASTPAAGTTPEMSDEEFRTKAQRDYEEAGKLPAPKGTTAEEKAARKSEDLWSALAQIGFGVAAGDSPYALTNIGKGAAAAMPGMQASLKERRADEKEDLRQQYAYQLAQAGVKGKAYEFSMTQFDKLKDNRFREKTLAETIRHNQEIENLQGQQVAQSGSTGTERLVGVIALGRAPGATDAQKRLADAAEYALKGYAGAVGGAEIANKARDNIDSAISKNINLSRTLNDLAKKDRANAKTGNHTTLYQDKYNEMIDAEERRLGRGSLGGQTPEPRPTSRVGRFEVSEG